MGSVFSGIGHIVGGIAHGVGDLFTGHPIKALKDAGSGIAHGALDILSNPLVGMVIGGPFGGLISGVAKGVDQKWNQHDAQEAMKKQCEQMQKIYQQNPYFCPMY